MAETAVGTRPGAGRRDGADGARTLRRHRALPGGRAVVGGFLVTLAAVGIFAGYTNATADTRVRYLVARHDLALGHRITGDDLTTLPMDLPAVLRSRSYRAPSQVVGSIVIGPVGEGELVQSSDVLAGQDGAADRQLSFPIDSARAVDGQLRKGEFVDVLATYGTGSDSYTVVVVPGARVADRTEPRGTLSDRGDEVVTLAVPRAADALALAHAVSAGAVTLVRAGGPAAAGTGAPSSYTAPGPAPGPVTAGPG